MKKKSKKEIDWIKVNLNTKNNYEKNKKINNITYVKIKENYDSYIKNNKSKKSSKDKLTLRKRLTKDNLETTKNNDIKDKKVILSLVPSIRNQRKNSKKKEELKKARKNNLLMKKLEYSFKIKKAVNIKKFKNYKYDINKIIIIQKWIKGYLLRSFLCNASEVDKIINEFISHIYKFIYFKFNILKKLKKHNLRNIRHINDNIIETKKYFSFINENESISNINTNFNTNTFTNNNTFSTGQETPEIFDNINRNRELLINSKRNYKTPSIRELLIINSDLDKDKIINKTINKNNKKEIYIKKIQKTKSFNYIKRSDSNINSKNNLDFKSVQIQSFSLTDLRIKGNDEINNKKGKTTNLRNLLFSNNNKNDEEKIFKKPLMNLSFISKIFYYNQTNIINNSPKSEKLFLPKIYQISLEENMKENINLKENNNNNFEYEKKIIIDEIKEAKEDEEDDSQSQILKKIKDSYYDDSEINIHEKNNTNYSIDYSISFQIKSRTYDRTKILIILLLERQIKLYLKPYVYNILKNYWKNNTFS